MREQIGRMVMIMLGMVATVSTGQNPVITTFKDNGQLTWTNTLMADALYSVEWASQADGPWYQTFQNLHMLDGRSNTDFSVSVPMFYRVVMVTNQPPEGMVWIEGGDVELGQTGIALPVHTNFISGFWMDAMEVTKSKWDEVQNWATANGYSFSFTALGKADNHPCYIMSWYDCVKWCNARSQKEGLKPCYYTNAALSSVYSQGSVDLLNDWVDWSANGYRLPTEAEWEKAARGGRQGRWFPWGGDTIQHARANYSATTNFSYDTSPTQGYHPTYNDGTWPYTSPVGSFVANGFGLYDMAGNVWEWCWDWHTAYSSVYQTDPRGPLAHEPYDTTRIVRGGSWIFTANRTRCASRYWASPSTGEGGPDYVGFRCVRGSLRAEL